MNLSRKLLALGLALGPLVPAAAAQPATGDWEVRFGKASKSSHVSVRAGSRGFGIDLASRRGRGHARHQASSCSTPPHRHGPSCGYVAGHYETRYERVWVPCRTERVWVPAQIEVSYLPCGRRVETVVAPAHWETIEHPGHYEQRQVRVWVPASYRCGTGITTYPNSRRRWR